jgi:thiamine biosynthesis lipoprotein ApbE
MLLEVSMGVLENYVILETGIPTRLHFTDHRKERRPITDTQTGQPTTRNVLVFEVDRMDGRAVAAKYSVMAEKHATQFEPYLADKRYTRYEFTIVRNGEGYRTVYSLTPTPLA